MHNLSGNAGAQKVESPNPPIRAIYATHTLPETGFLRLLQIIGNAKAEPPIPAIFPVGKSAWWAGVKSGRFPKAVKLGPRTTAWRVEDIKKLIEAQQ